MGGRSEVITLYTDATPNGRRVSLMLEETGLTYRVHRINLGCGEHRRPSYLKINPSGQIPTIIDDDAAGKGELILTQTIAILIYLAEKTCRLMCHEPMERARMWEWLALDATDIAPTRFDGFLLSVRGGEEMEIGVDLLNERVMKFYHLMDWHLGKHRYLAGETLSIADISAYPWAVSMEHPRMPSLKNLQRWMDMIGQRPAVQRGMMIPAGR